MRLLLTAFFLEVGFVLAVVPWSSYWERNYFAEWLPALHDLITNNFIRGAVSGLGLVNIGAGVLELFAVFSARRIEEPFISLRSTSADE
jgi:polyferredoxin